MAEDDEIRKVVQDMDAAAKLQRDAPIEIHLPDPGPYILPRMRAASAYVADRNTFEIHLDTEKHQRIRIPIDGSQLLGLKMLIDHLVQQTNKSR